MIWVGSRIEADRLAQVHVADRGAAGGVALRRGVQDHLAHPLDHDAGLGAKGLGEPALDHRIGERRHAALVRDLDALVPEVLRLHVAGGRAQRQADQPLAVPGAQHLPDHAALGQAAEMRALDAERIEQADRVGGQQLDAVGPRGRSALAMATAVVAQRPVALGERRHLRVPHLEPGAERVAEQHHGRIRRPFQLVADGDAVGVDLRHVMSLPWWGSLHRAARPPVRPRSGCRNDRCDAWQTPRRG